MVIRPPDFKPALGVAKSLLNDVKTTTTEIEAFGVAASKAGKAAFSGLNKTNQEIRKMTSYAGDIALKLNLPVDNVTKSLVALEQQGVDVRKFGFKGFEQFQKVIEVTGADSGKLATGLGKMQIKMAKNPALMKKIVGEVVALGKQSGIGREALNNLGDASTLLMDNMNRLPQSWDDNGESMGRFLKGSTAVAGALVKMGLSGDEAIQASNQLTEAMLKGQEGLADMFTGIKSDMPDIAQVMTVQLGDAGAAFKLLSESPDQFMLKLGNLVETVRNMPGMTEDKLNMFRGQFSQVLGPKAMAAFTKDGIGRMGPVLAKATGPIEGSATAIEDIGKLFEDGRTHAQRFALAQDMVTTKLKDLHGVLSDDQYLKAYNTQSKDFLKTMNQLANKKGPIGKATSLLVDFRMRGVGGALAAHSQWGFALSEGMKVMEPFLGYLPALRSAFGALMSPIGAAAAAIGALFFLFKDLGKGSNSVVRPYLERLEKEAPQLIKKAWDVFTEVVSTISGVIANVVSKIDWAAVGNVIGNFLSKAGDFAVFLAFKSIDLLGRMIDWFAALDWGAIGNWLGQALTKTFGWALMMTVTVVKRIPELFVAIVKAVIGVFDGIEETLSNAFPRLSGLFKVVFTTIKVVAIPVLAALAAHFTVVAAKAIYSASTTAAAWVATQAKIVYGTGVMIAQNAKAAWSTLSLLGTIAKFWIETSLSSQTGALFIAKQWLIAWGPVIGIGIALAAVVVVVIKFWDKIKAIFWKAVDAIKGFFSKAWDEIESVVLAPIEAIKKGWNAVTGFFGGLLDKAKSAFSSAWSWIEGKATGAWNAITGKVSGGFDFTKMNSQIQEAAAKAKQASADATKSIKTSTDSAKTETSGLGAFVEKATTGASKVVSMANTAVTNFVNEAVKRTEDHLKRAKELAFPKLSGTEQLDIIQQYRETQEQIKNLQTQYDKETNEEKKKHLIKAAKDIQAKQLELAEDYRGKYGKSLQLAADLTTRYQEEGFNKLGDSLANLSGAEQKVYKQRIDAATSYFALQELQLETEREAAQSEAEKERIWARQVELSDKRAAAVKTLSDQINASAKAGMVEIKDFAAKTDAEVGALSVRMVASFTAASNSAAAEWAASGPAGEALKSAMDALDASYKATLADLETNSKLKGEKLAAAMRKAEEDFIKSRKVILDQKAKFDTELITADADTQKKIADNITATADKVVGSLGKIRDRNAEQAGIIKQEWKMSAADAADSVSKISMINPKEFRANVRIIKDEMVKFLEKMDKEAKDLTTGIDKNIKKYWEDSKKGWADQETLITQFGDKMQIFVTKFWGMVVEQSSKAAGQIIQISKDIATSMTLMAKTINLMDLLASPSQITQWAASVVSALAYAFRTGGAADAMISASYNKALQMASEVSHAAGPATPDTGAPKSSPSSSAITAATELMRAMHHPAWATDEKAAIPAQLRLMNKNLEETLKALRAMAEGRATAAPKKPNNVNVKRGGG